MSDTIITTETMIKSFEEVLTRLKKIARVLERLKKR